MLILIALIFIGLPLALLVTCGWALMRRTHCD
jgi:hypothetical protein